MFSPHNHVSKNNGPCFPGLALGTCILMSWTECLLTETMKTYKAKMQSKLSESLTLKLPCNALQKDRSHLELPEHGAVWNNLFSWNVSRVWNNSVTKLYTSVIWSVCDRVISLLSTEANLKVCQLWTHLQCFPNRTGSIKCLQYYHVMARFLLLAIGVQTTAVFLSLIRSI